jgi:hypothetical protein
MVFGDRVYRSRPLLVGCTEVRTSGLRDEVKGCERQRTRLFYWIRTCGVDGKVLELSGLEGRTSSTDMVRRFAPLDRQIWLSPPQGR